MVKPVDGDFNHMPLLNSVYRYNIVQFLVHSNLFLALAAASVAFTTMVLARLPLQFEPVLISFSIVFFMYNVNRFTDIEEDEVNTPRRASFVRKYGEVFLVLSTLIYIASLGLAWGHSLTALLLTIGNIGLGLAYSVLRLKEIFFLKNFIVGLGWGILPLIAGSYSGAATSLPILFLAAFFTVSYFRSTMIFDIKDIEGDLKEGVKTIPNTLGFDTTVKLSYVIDSLLIATELALIAAGYLNPQFLILIPFHLYIFGYLKILDRDSGKPLYYLIVDGETIFLGLAALLMFLIGG